ncbi:MAG: indole-3-glycerol phosphate synthase TrpC [Pedobacter sp.]|nr:MAG: indole-3-glycerol phosphate synthase TrpC [Pedobacter sp.]
MTENNILDKIVKAKKLEINKAKLITPIQELQLMPGFNRTCASLKDALLNSQTGIIAEFKRRSPSKGIINRTVQVQEVVRGYDQAGAAAISILTDPEFFGGSSLDLILAREATELPLLRKDFILDEYQLLEAKAWGADIILLIAAILSPSQVRDLSNAAQNLGLSVLLEVHTVKELEMSIGPNIDAVGINNRNLADFSLNIQTSFDMVSHIPAAMLKVSESAISDPALIIKLKKAGFNGFLIGENFMRTEDPGRAMEDFVKGSRT